MAAVRYVLRVGMVLLAGLAAGCGLVLLFNAQVALNRYAELSIKTMEAIAQANASTGITAVAGDVSRVAHASQPVAGRHGGREADDSTVPASDANREAERASGPHVQGSPPPPASSLVEGERSIRVHVSDADRIANVAAPDRWVDVVFTHTSAGSPGISDVVLGNVRVLTVEPVAADVSSSERPSMHAVTFDVDVETARNLAIASQVGTLSLVPHRPSDRDLSRVLEPPPPERPTLEPPTPAPSASELSEGESAAARDQARFVTVRVNRIGGVSSTHRVLREQ